MSSSSVVKNPPANAGGAGDGSSPGIGRSPEGGNGNPVQYSCLGISMDRGACGAAVLEVTKDSDTTEGLSTQLHFLAA